MSDLETEFGQVQVQPTVEGQQATCDKNAEPDIRSKKKDHQIIVGFNRPHTLRLIIIRMTNISTEIGLMLLIAFTYAALTNDPPKVSKSPPAYPFFPKGSIVKDYYRGELTKAIEQARQSDIAFVMFYAPWDSESQEVKKEFEVAARYMQKLVSFTAVNCWQPDGECRNHYNKVYNWPVLIAYPTYGRGIQYNGPKSALHMVRFLNSILEPLVRVNNLELQLLRQKHDAVILANVNALPGSLDYAIIYTTALRYLEKDPFQEVIFAVNTEYFSGAQKLSIYTWNNTIAYIDKDWKVEALLTWIFKNIVQVSIWAAPSGTKSQQLSNYILPGPALILFTPRNPLYDNIDYYDLLHEVALQYYYCKNNTYTFGAYLLSLGIHYSRKENYRKSKIACTSTEDIQRPIKPDFPNTVTYVNKNKWTNNSYCTSPKNKKDVCINDDISHMIGNRLGYEDGGKYRQKLDQMYVNMMKRDLEETRKKNSWVETDFVWESYKNVYKTSMLTGINDPKSPKNLQRIRKQNKCRLKAIAEKYHSPQFSESTITNKDYLKVDITGLACQVNRSLSMIAMDSLKYYHFANSLSIDILNKRHKTAVVILDEKMESHYVLNDMVTDTSIREFIQNFSENNLKRALVTSSKTYNYTHTYNSEKNIRKNTLRITELDSMTFLPTIMEKNKAVVVFYYSKQCSFCNGMAYTFLSTAQVLSSVTNLKFTRIDGDLNTLPWEYTMESYPTILFVPDIKKSESRSFPKNTPITVKNLVNFILSNLNPSLKLHSMWSICTHIKLKEEKKICISKVRIETLSLIEKSLKEWRMSDLRNKAVILDKLRELKHLHLLLAHLPANTNSIERCMRRLQQKTFSLSVNKRKAKKLQQINL